MTETPTHDYDTVQIPGDLLDDTMVLVGECGGLSAVLENEVSSVMVGLIVVRTEHGPLYLDPGERYAVLDDVTRDWAGLIKAQTEAAINGAGGDPSDDATWDARLLEKAVELALPLTFTADIVGVDQTSTLPGHEDLLLEDFANRRVVVIGPEDMTSEPLFRVKTKDGVEFAAWKSELGL